MKNLIWKHTSNRMGYWGGKEKGLTRADIGFIATMIGFGVPLFIKIFC